MCLLNFCPFTILSFFFFFLIFIDMSTQEPKFFISFFLIPKQTNPNNQSCRFIQKPNQNQQKTNLRTQKELNTHMLRNSERQMSVFRATFPHHYALYFPTPFPVSPIISTPKSLHFSHFLSFFPRIQSWDLFSNSMSGKNCLLGRELDFDQGGKR